MFWTFIFRITYTVLWNVEAVYLRAGRVVLPSRGTEPYFKLLKRE